MSQRAASNVETIVDRENKTVSVPCPSDMPPRIAAWQPGLGCAQLPVGATMDLAAHLTRLPDAVTARDFDDRKWPLGDVDLHRKAPLRGPAQPAGYYRGGRATVPSSGFTTAGRACPMSPMRRTVRAASTR